MSKKKSKKANVLPNEIAVRKVLADSSGDDYLVASENGVCGVMEGQEGPDTVGIYRLVRVYYELQRVYDVGTPDHGPF